MTALAVPPRLRVSAVNTQATLNLAGETSPAPRSSRGHGALRAALSCAATVAHTPAAHMTKLLGFVGATIGSYAGWALGALVGTMTAFMLSIVLTGVGLYAGRRVARHFES